MRFRLVVGGTLGAVLVLSAGSAFAAPLSEQKWQKQGNAICKQANRELDGIDERVFVGLEPGDEPSAEQMAAFAEEFVPIIDDALSSIDALAEPRALKRDVKRLKAAVAEALEEILADPVAAFSYEHDPFVKVGKIAKKLGLKQCA